MQHQHQPQQLPSLSDARALLLAVNLASAGEISQLTQLAAARKFPSLDLLRVLLCLPETTPPEVYLPLVQAVLAEREIAPASSEEQIDVSHVLGGSEKTVKKQVERHLSALGLRGDSEDLEGRELVADFLELRAVRIDADTGALSTVEALLAPFDHLPRVRQLLDGTVRVLEKLVYTFERDYPAANIATFRSLPPEDALSLLLADEEHIARDLRELVEPYMAARNPDWNAVWERLRRLSFRRFVDLNRAWNPPKDAADGYCRLAISKCYSTNDVDMLDGTRAIHRHVSALAEDVSEDLPSELGDLSDPSNPLVVPTQGSLALLDLMITSCSILSLPLLRLLRLRLEGRKDEQARVLETYIRGSANWNKRSDGQWREVRDAAQWLRMNAGVLGRLSNEDVEKALLSGMLAGTRFALARELYVNHNGGLLMDDVEMAVLEHFAEFYDNATNGNKTRGGMKMALQTIQVLYPHSSHSDRLERAWRLISATHNLSTYSLTLTPGVPLRPVQVRIHADPVSLISRLLEANTRSYLQPDALISIAQDLALGTGKLPPDQTVDDVAARVLAMCCDAALSEDDFETAYAYVTSRLLPSASSTSSSAARSALWGSALQAGRFRSPYAALSGATPRGPTGLKMLEKKMELLAIAIRFCPKEALSEVLAEWRRREDELEVLLAAELRAEEEHARMAGGAALPKQIRRGSVQPGEEEAPKSLFQVAGAAARVFSAGRGLGGLAGGLARTTTEHDAEAKERTRKRDVVSGMVSSGLASGIGWVIGAPAPSGGNH